MEQRDVKALRRDRGEAGISIAENKVSVRLQFGQQFIGPTEDVPASDTKVLTYNRHQNIGTNLAVSIVQFKVFPEHRARVRIPILVIINNTGIKILTATLHHGCETDDLRAGTAADHDL